MAVQLQSSAFASNQPIPTKYTADGDDVSPPLRWSGLPGEAEELALICDDPDAPMDEPFVHWVLYKLSISSDGLPEGIPATWELDQPADALQGVNSFDNIGYGGPAPPEGHGVHHYHFTLYALDTALNVEREAKKAALLDAMNGHVLADGELVGTYER